MKLFSALILFALAAITQATGLSAGADVPQPQSGAVDASKIPESEWMDEYRVYASRDGDGTIQSTDLKPIKWRSVAFENAIPASKLVVKPRPKLQPKPSYPLEMRKRNVQGLAVVAFVVRPDGRAREAIAIGANDESFAKAAVEAVNQWVFIAAPKDAPAVRCVMVVPITFTKYTPAEEEQINALFRSKRK